MFIAANTRWQAAASNVFKLIEYFAMIFLNQVHTWQVFPEPPVTYN